MSVHHLLGRFHCYSSQYMCLGSPVESEFFSSQFWVLFCGLPRNKQVHDFCTISLPDSQTAVVKRAA